MKYGLYSSIILILCQPKLENQWKHLVDFLHLDENPRKEETKPYFFTLVLSGMIKHV